MKILGRFAYAADVVPKGSRRPRRELLFGAMEHEIREIAVSDLVAEALVVDAYVGSRDPLRRTVLAGHEGRLWTPLVPRTLRPEADERRPLSAKRLEGLLKTPFPLSPNHPETPIDDACKDRFSPLPKYDAVALAQRAEENYRGTVLRSYKAEAVERYRRAARDILLVDGTAYTTACEPYWRYREGYDSDPGLHLRDFPYHDGMAMSFRLDRLAEAREFMGARAEVCPVRGAIHRIEPEFLSRDDLSHYVNGRLDGLLEDKLAQIVPFMPAHAVEAWVGLKRSADKESARADAPFAGDVREAVMRLEMLRGEVELARVPRALDGMRARVVAEFAKFFRRVEFEMVRRPALVVEDEAALGKLAP